MIQAYLKDNRDYQNNGDMVLFPESCTVSAQLNGTWKMELSHPLDEDGRWKYIEEEGVIAAPTFMGEKQLFRISTVVKEDGEISAEAYPVFFDSANDCFLNDVRPTIKNGQEALDIMTAGSKYSGASNIRKADTAYFVRRNLMAAIGGEEEPTFLGRWGGEILYDNYKIIINEQVGGDYGIEARYGKNIIGIEYEVDFADVVTRIVPVSYNGHTIRDANGYVDSPLISRYAKMYICEIKFEDVKLREDSSEDDEKNGIIVCDTQAELDAALTKKCEEQFRLGIDLPAVSMSIDMELLSRTEEYKDYVLLETVGLGDTINCIHEKLGISTQARVVKIEWDCIRNKPGKIELGDFKYDYFRDARSKFQDVRSAADALSGVFNPDGSVMAERVKGILDGIKVQLKYQKDIAQKQDVRAILFEDLDPNSPTYGAMCLGTQGFEISNKQTEDGRDWEWTTAFTAQGGYANAIVTGLLSDKLGKNYWDLDTGEFRLSPQSTVGDKTVEDIAKDAVNRQTQADIFNKLTNNGKAQGIFTDDNGLLYMNATYLSTGVLQSHDGKTFYLDLDKGILRMEVTELKIAGQSVNEALSDAVVSIEQQYYQSNSATSLSGGSWSSEQPSWAQGKYIWNRQYVRYGDGTLAYLPSEKGVCISGNSGTDGKNGENGIGVSGVVAQYFSNTSDTSAPSTNAAWSTTMPAVKKGEYIWARQKITYSNGSSTYTTPYCMSKTMGDIAEFAIDSQTQEDIFNKLTNNGKQQGLYLDNGLIYLNAAYIATGILTDKTGKTSWDLDTGVFKNVNGSEWLQIYESVITSGYGSTKDGLLDLSAQYADGRNVVLEAITGNLILKAKKGVSVESSFSTTGKITSGGELAVGGAATFNANATFNHSLVLTDNSAYNIRIGDDRGLTVEYLIDGFRMRWNKGVLVEVKANSEFPIN